MGTLPLRATARMGVTTKVVVAFEVLSSFFPLLKQWAIFSGVLCRGNARLLDCSK